MAILSAYMPNDRVANYLMQELVELKGEIDRPKIKSWKVQHLSLNNTEN